MKIRILSFGLGIMIIMMSIECRTVNLYTYCSNTSNWGMESLNSFKIFCARLLSRGGDFRNYNNGTTVPLFGLVLMSWAS